MATGQNSAYIVDKGSPNAIYAEVNTSGTLQEAYKTFGIVKDIKFDDDTAQNERQDAGGNTYTSDGARKVSGTLTVLQRSSDDINFAVKDYRGKRIQLIIEGAEDTMDSKYQYFCGAICKVTPKTSISLPGGEVPYEFVLEKNTSAITVDMSDTCITTVMTPTALTGTMTVAANTYWNVDEFATS